MKNQFNCFVECSIFWIWVLISLQYHLTCSSSSCISWKLEVMLRSLVRLRWNMFFDCILSGGTCVSTSTIWSATINHMIKTVTTWSVCYILVHFPLCMSTNSFKQIFENVFIIEIQLRFLSLGLNSIQKASLFVELLYSFPFGGKVTALRAEVSLVTFAETVA